MIKVDVSQVKFDAQGLIPAIAQDSVTGQVLMLAYMNAESLRLTLETGYATYFSRGRQQLWKKGETSGNVQKVLAVTLDCDGDALLLTVEPAGPACHTGETSCFYRAMAGEAPATSAVLEAVYRTITDRAANPREGSYTNYLLLKGPEKTCKKVGEEASETIIAAIKGSQSETRYEAADLCYHLLVLLYQMGLKPADIWRELDGRRSTD